MGKFSVSNGSNPECPRLPFACATVLTIVLREGLPDCIRMVLRNALEQQLDLVRARAHERLGFFAGPIDALLDLNQAKSPAFGG
jgi:hypothetical protein